LETVTWPKPEPGLVIRYSFLWSKEADEGREEGVKDRPCAIIVVVHNPDLANPLVRVLPITHRPPADGIGALELPQATKQRLGLDSERSWIVLDEANDFVWPGPDLRTARSGDLDSVVYGMLPQNFIKVLREKSLTRFQQKKSRAVRRSE
jgi:hypothetical protein